MTTFKLSGPFAPDFTFSNMKVLTIKPNGSPVVSYTSTFKARDYFSIRELWFDENRGFWMPGKGFSVPADMAPKLCAAVGALAKPQAVKVKDGPQRTKGAGKMKRRRAA